MSIAFPEPGIAVDPNRVLSHLRQVHAQRLDAADYQNAQLTAALEDAQATISEVRIRAEELGTQTITLQARVTELERQLEERTTAKPAGNEPAHEAAGPGPLAVKRART